MSEDNKKKIIKEITNFYTVFQKEILDLIPDESAEISPLSSKVLREIYFTEGITSSVLAKRLSITVPNTSRCLQHLGDLEYIARVKDENDRRITHIKLTKKGTELVEKSIRTMEDLMLHKLYVLELDELVRLSEAFSTMKALFGKIGNENAI